MARRKSKLGHAEEEHENSERWLLTYADMITLLMVLFIVLFAIGATDAKKFEKLHDGLADSFGESTVYTGGSGLLDGSGIQAAAPDNSTAGSQALQRQRMSMLAAQMAADTVSKQAAQAARKEAETMAALQTKISKALAKNGLADAVTFHKVDRRGLEVDIVTDRVLFDTGQATLRPKGERVLDALAPALKGLPNDLVIEGHTDSQPISDSQFASNWELSTERATTVLRHLLVRGVEASNVAAAGYADQRPLLGGESVASLARNRRVAIVILFDRTIVSLPPAVPAGVFPLSASGA
jgi:chemotaxis protein MotB